MRPALGGVLRAAGRPSWVWLHRYVGLATALFLTIAALTGSAIVFMPEIDTWLNPSLFRVQPTGLTLPVSELVSRFEKSYPHLKVAVLSVPLGQEDSVFVFVESRLPATELENNQFFIDQYSGAVLGQRFYGAARIDAAHVMPFLRRVHYSLHIPGAWGIWFMGVVALAWTVDCFIGLYLTFPRSWPFWKNWRPMWRVKRKARRYRLNLDLHRVAGLWLWLVLLLLAATSIALNLPSEVYRPVLSALLPTTPTIWEQPGPTSERTMIVGFEAALSQARLEGSLRGWHQTPARIFSISTRGVYLVQFSGEHEPGFGRSQMWVDGHSGAIVRADRAGAGRAGDLVDNLVLPIHTGQVAGLAGRVLIFVAGLAIALLSVTGTLVWFKKRSARSTRKALGL